jgi:hypothetical protein
METIRIAWPEAAPERLVQIIPEAVRPKLFTTSHAAAFAKIARTEIFPSLKDLETSLVKYFEAKGAKMTNKACSSRDLNSFEKWINPE